MNKLSLFAVALFLTSLVHAEPAKVRLWPDDAPGAKGDEDKDQPFVYVWPAAKEKANGAAFVVCPGGGYGGLRQTMKACRWRSGSMASA